MVMWWQWLLIEMPAGLTAVLCVLAWLGGMAYGKDVIKCRAVRMGLARWEITTIGRPVFQWQLPGKDKQNEDLTKPSCAGDR